LAISFKSSAYNIPIAIWITKHFPNLAPIVFVMPTETMLLKTSKHVDSTGRIYHPFLAYWNQRTQSSLTELAQLLRQIFEAEPPVYSKPDANLQRNPQPMRPKSIEVLPQTSPIIPPVSSSN
jgi:ESCRT-I complex subunit TSG101